VWRGTSVPFRLFLHRAAVDRRPYRTSTRRSPAAGVRRDSGCGSFNHRRGPQTTYTPGERRAATMASVRAYREAMGRVRADADMEIWYGPSLVRGLGPCLDPANVRPGRVKQENQRRSRNGRQSWRILRKKHESGRRSRRKRAIHRRAAKLAANRRMKDGLQAHTRDKPSGPVQARFKMVNGNTDRPQPPSSSTERPGPPHSGCSARDAEKVIRDQFPASLPVHSADDRRTVLDVRESLTRPQGRRRRQRRTRA